MNRHGFDPVSAVLGVIAVGGGVAVVAGAGDVVDSTAVGVWIAALALAVGVVMLPWGRRDRRTVSETVSESETGESDLVDLDA